MSAMSSAWAAAARALATSASYAPSAPTSPAGWSAAGWLPPGLLFPPMPAVLLPLARGLNTSVMRPTGPGPDTARAAREHAHWHDSPTAECSQIENECSRRRRKESSAGKRGPLWARSSTRHPRPDSAAVFLELVRRHACAGAASSRGRFVLACLPSSRSPNRTAFSHQTQPPRPRGEGLSTPPPRPEEPRRAGGAAGIRPARVLTSPHSTPA